MGLARRVELYRRIEAIRQRPLVVFVTSSREGASGAISNHAVSELQDQLLALPDGAKALDLMIASRGGDPIAAWRIVSLIRERVDELAVLVPEAAFSAATLVALGADEIVMHPFGNLGPVDPQIALQRTTGEGLEVSQFAYQDLVAFLDFAKQRVGLTDQEQLLAVLQAFCQEVGTVPVGLALRGAQLGQVMTQRLLRTHMRGERQGAKADAIAQVLGQDFFHHGYPLSRKEAREIGLPLSDPSEEVRDLMWAAWRDVEDELLAREPFYPTAMISPGEESAPYRLVEALMESARRSAVYETTGRIWAARGEDLQLRVNMLPERSRWSPHHP
jgi:hypothetical protein